MKYKNKNDIRDKLKKRNLNLCEELYQEGDDAAQAHEQKQMKVFRKRIGKGKSMNSHKKKVGNIVNKESLYDKLEKQREKRQGEV